MGSLPGLVCVEHPGVQDTVKLEGNVVCGDGALARDLDGILLQAPDVSDAIDDGHQNGQPRLQYAVELSHALDDPCCLLRDEADDGVCRQAFV